MTETKPTLVCNRIKCRGCKDVIESMHRHDYVVCSCKSVAVDGGVAHARRVVMGDFGYDDKSVFVEDGHEAVRKVFKRGSYGKNGDEPLHYIALKDMTDDHLQATIQYNENYKATSFQQIYLDEVEYRKANGIIVEETNV